jgi:DNA-binding NtrC family response regulator
MEEDIARSREAGFSEHLTKPINFQRLESAIAQAAADRPPHAESALDSRKKSSPPGTNGYSAPARSKRPRSTNSRARLAP